MVFKAGRDSRRILDHVLSACPGHIQLPQPFLWPGKLHFLLLPGELAYYFNAWQVMHNYAGEVAQSQRAMSRIIARKPQQVSSNNQQPVRRVRAQESLLKIAQLNFGRDRRRSTLPFGCEVERSRRKTLAVYIIQGKVVVRCPMRASNAQITTFLNDNKAWIEQRLVEESLRLKQALRVERGARIFYRARELTIVFREGRKQRILVDGDKFIIQGHKLTPAKARLQLEEFLIDKASNYIMPRARGLARYLGVDRKLKEIKLRKTKSKWGHCTSTGIIQYNYLIMLAPYSIIDYMITHEVCHLLHMDHSQRFWNLVDSLCPNSEHYMTWLKEHEHRFWI